MATRNPFLRPEIKPKTIHANGLEFAYIEAGTGELVLCLHGFPDTARSFDFLLDRLAAAGYHAVAPFMRGIFPTTIPPDGDYSPVALAEDILSLIQAFGYPRAIIVGHDWGALAAYTAANLDGSRISRMVTIAIPHPRAIRMTPRSLFRTWHFAFLPLPFVAEFVARRDHYRLLRHFRRSWSPHFQDDPALIESMADSYSHPGVLAAALGYYRSFMPAFGGIGKEGKRQREIMLRKTSTPTLCFAGNEDGVFDNETFERTREAFIGPYELVKINNTGHFLHLECPEDFIAKSLDFLKVAAAG